MKYDFQKMGLSHLKKSDKTVRYFSFETFIVTFCFIGMIPLAPGTMGTLAVYPVFYYVTEMEPMKSIHFDSLKDQVIFLFWILTIFFSLIGTWAIKKFQQNTRTFDHKSIVIDEVIGMLLVLAIAFDWLYDIAIYLSVYIDLSLRNLMFLVGFVTFRYFDISKPLIVGIADEKIKHPFGVILDDILAGLFAAGTIFIVAQIINAIS